MVGIKKKSERKSDIFISHVDYIPNLVDFIRIGPQEKCLKIKYSRGLCPIAQTTLILFLNRGSASGRYIKKL